MQWSNRKRTDAGKGKEGGTYTESDDLNAGERQNMLMVYIIQFINNDPDVTKNQDT